MSSFKNLEFRVHTPNLLKLVLELRDGFVLRIPIATFGDLLASVAERASQLNDPILNGLMCKLALYDISDPTSESFDVLMTKELIAECDKLLLLDKAYKI